MSCLTIGIPDALWSAAGDGVRLGDETALAAADGVAGQVEGADRPGAAGGRLAGVRPHDAPLALAHVPAGAVRVPAARSRGISAEQ